MRGAEEERRRSREVTIIGAFYTAQLCLAMNLENSECTTGGGVEGGGRGGVE